MHTVKESGTFTSQDGTKSTQLNAGDQIGEAEALELGLISEDEAKAAGVTIPERKDAGKAPENKSKAAPGETR